MKHARGRLKLTQTDLAKMLGVSRRTVAEWEASGDGALSVQIAGRLSTVFTDMQTGPSSQDTPPLAAVSDLELVTEMGRRLSSLRSQLDAAAASRGDGAVETDVTPRTGRHSDDDGLPSPTYPSDAGASGMVGTETNDSAQGSPRFTDREGDC